MEIAKLVLEYLKILAWPAVVLIGLYIFRRELRRLIESLEHLKLPGGAELDWKKKVQEVELAAEKIETSPSTGGVPIEKKQLQALIEKLEEYEFARSPTDYDWNYYRKLTKDDPNLALAGLRMEIERMLQNMSEASGVFDNRIGLYADSSSTSGRIGTSAGKMVRLLRDARILGPNESELLYSILNIANAALHGRDATEDEALRVINSAETFKELYLAFMGRLIAQRDAERNAEGR